jgi:hypothetical protein
MDEGAMPLIDMPDSGLDPQGPKCTDAACPQDDLLGEPHLPATDVEDAGDCSIPWIVVRHVRVQEQQRDPPDLDQPELGRNLAFGKRDAHQETASPGARDGPDRESGEVVHEVAMLLEAVRIDGLAEITTTVQQPNTDEWETEIAGALQMISGQDPEAPCVER